MPEHLKNQLCTDRVLYPRPTYLPALQVLSSQDPVATRFVQQLGSRDMQVTRARALCCVVLQLGGLSTEPPLQDAGCGGLALALWQAPD